MFGHTKYWGIRAAAVSLPVVLVVSSLALAAEPDRRLVDAEADQDTALVRTLLKQHVNVNATRADGATALLWAAHWSDLETADLLLRAGANVNAADNHGVTPLAQAAENASVPMVERLLKAGANPNLAQLSGMTPLMTATHTGNPEIVKTLLGHGANVNAATSETKTTALMWAVADGNQAAAKLLIEAHADVRASSAKGITPLLYAATTGNVEMAKVLLAAGVNPNETGSDGTHALPLSIVKGNTDFALFLLDRGADPSSDIDGIPALHAASGNVGMWLGDWSRGHQGLNNYSSVRGPEATGDKKVELVKALLARGANVNGRIAHSAMFMGYVGYPKKGAFETYACGTGDVRGATPLWVAAYTANGNATPGAGSEIIRVLLAAGADMRLTTDDGTTPLMEAAGLGRCSFIMRSRGVRSVGAEEAVKILAEAGADLNATNEADYTALHGAAFRGLDEVVEYLVQHGANINARDYRGRTPYRLAEGSHQSFELQAWPETAEVLKRLGADTHLGLPGTVQERLQDFVAQPLAASRSGN